MRILVTAFEPFGSDSENASGAALRELLAGWSHPVIELVGEELPVVFDDAPQVLTREVAAELYGIEAKDAGAEALDALDAIAASEAKRARQKIA